MGLFAAMMTYLAAVTLLVGGMVTALTLLLAKPANEPSVAEKPRPPLVRAADRQAAEALKTAPPTKAAPAPQSDGSAVNRPPASPQVKAPEPAKRAAGEGPRKKKAARRPAPSAPARETGEADTDTSTLGYSPSGRRKFVFPLDPEW